MLIIITISTIDKHHNHYTKDMNDLLEGERTRGLWCEFGKHWAC